MNKVFGLEDHHAAPNTCRVLAGCDVRADLVTSAYGQILVHKSQSKIHIEHNNMAKMAKLGALPIAGRVVLDALAGPGTLGLMSAVSYTHLRAHETRHDLVCRLLLEKKKKKQ